MRRFHNHSLLDDAAQHRVYDLAMIQSESDKTIKNILFTEINKTEILVEKPKAK